MKQLNKFSMQLLSRSANESFARVAVSAFVTQLDPTIEEINDIKTAVSEAVTNCIVHAYKNEIGNIYIQVRILECNVVEIKIRDKGCGIPDVDRAMEPLYTTAGGERAGLGFAVMQSFMDNLRVVSKVGKGTTVTMKKRISVRVKSNGQQG
ncbi:MAG: anti-sigma F factor [Clostridia bacterium]|nr:anti-sigma F factor [Clostridia bacterium]MBQ2274042.1 anti-sigma F factor [Clostridia bacterium]MBQ5798249.1 anti-sigma F factor [Clostridia bacterium]MBQ5900976.1 anti-sigma F factor [Clostridia bacterium]MEE1278344.1 anti-sigma F factor [Acutalibacteraceae bacterium]